MAAAVMPGIVVDQQKMRRIHESANDNATRPEHEVTTGEMSGMTKRKTSITAAEATTIALENRVAKGIGTRTGTEDCIGMFQVACKMVFLAEDTRLCNEVFSLQDE
jgi:hypothetical protein